MTDVSRPVGISFPALGTTAGLLVTDPAALVASGGRLKAGLAAVDAACSRFRSDSELSRVNAAGGAAVRVSALFGEFLTSALAAAAATGGAVDPTVGASVSALGYDRSFPSVAPDDPRPVRAVTPRHDWRSVSWDPASGQVRIPAGVALDLGATAKACAADRAAAVVARTQRCGVLVNVGGDIAIAGVPPQHGWQVTLAEDHRASDAGGPVVAVRAGGLATSGTAVRAWRRGGRTLHHIVDPATGEPAAPVWRTVSVVAARCADANAAATAAVVLGERAVAFLTGAGLAARLVRPDGRIIGVGGWPDDLVPGGGR